MHVFYQAQLADTTFTLPEDESKHCIRVLRMQNGDEVYIADGNGTKALARIVDDHPKRCVLEVVSVEQLSKAQSGGRSYYLHVLVAPTKNFDRMEWFIEKAVEVGVDEITFVETANSERAKVNMERCEKIAISAMKQSKQWYLPKINPVVPMAEALAMVQQHSRYICWCPSPETDLFSHQLSSTDTIAVMVGPEGDFTLSETQLASQYKFRPVSLGHTILRTETAALFVCMAAKSVLV